MECEGESENEIDQGGKTFLLSHHTCWLPEEKMFQKHGLMYGRSPVPWIHQSMSDLSSLKSYAQKILCTHQDIPTVDHSTRRGFGEVMQFNDNRIVPWDDETYEYSKSVFTNYLLPCTNYATLTPSEPMKYLSRYGILTRYWKHSKAVSSSSKNNSDRNSVGEIYKSLVCNVCKKQLASKCSLNRHIREVHTLERPYICEICKKRFKCSNSLKKHYFSHSDVKAYACDVCQKAFKYKYSLKEHQRVHRHINVAAL